jgi:arsenite methyltransferase
VQDMLSRARKNAEKMGLNPPQVTFLHGYLTDPFPTEIAESSVDCVISNCVLNLVPSARKASILKEVFRVLKPGGRIALDDIVARKDMPDEIRDNIAAYVGCISGAVEQSVYEGYLKEAGFLGLYCWLTFYSPCR